MNPIDELVRRGYGGYVGWNDPQAAMNDFQQTGGRGKETQQIPQGWQPRSQVMGAQTQAPQGGMFSGIGQGFQQFTDWAGQQAQNIGNAFLPIASRITQQFGIKSPFDVFSGGVNTGTDFAVPVGTPVVAPTGRWRVVAAFNQAQGRGFIGNGTNNGYGNSVMIQNMDTGERLRFSHLSQVGVRPGDIIGGGVVALSGATGNVTGPHLDVEYYDAKGKLADPLKSPYMQQKLVGMGQMPKPEPPKPAPQSGEKTQPEPKPNPYQLNADLNKMFLAPKRVNTETEEFSDERTKNPFELGVPLT